MSVETTKGLGGGPFGWPASPDLDEAWEEIRADSSMRPFRFSSDLAI